MHLGRQNANFRADLYHPDTSDRVTNCFAIILSGRPETELLTEI